MCAYVCVHRGINTHLLREIKDAREETALPTSEIDWLRGKTRGERTRKQSNEVEGTGKCSDSQRVIDRYSSGAALLFRSERKRERERETFA